MAVLKSTIDGVTWAKVNGKVGPVGAVGLPGPAGYGRNRVINGDFSINQRAFTTSGIGASVWGPDRWKCIGYGSPMTMEVQTTVPGELGEGSRQYLRLVTSGGQTNGVDHYMRLWQFIESALTLNGKTVTVSFWARAATGTPKIGVDWYTGFGSGGSTPPVYTPVGQVTISTVWTRYSLTFNAPSLAGKVLGTDDRVELNFFVSAGTNFDSRFGPIGMQNNTFDFWGIQAEEGSFATPFEQKNYNDELRACQRYFQRWQQPPLRGMMTNPSWGARFGMPLPVTMRKAPTATMNGQFAIYDGSGTGVATSIAGSFLQPMLVEFDLQCNTFSAAGRTGILYQSGASYLDLSAEY